MRVNTNKWLKDFYVQIKNLQILFMSEKLPGFLHDYYDIKVSNGDPPLILIIKDELPDNIANALNNAFKKSLLKNTV